MTKIYAKNKKAQHEYFIKEKFEAGIQLKGCEVKSIRQSKVSLKESYVSDKNGELYVVNMHISPYLEGNIQNTDPLRKRKLLLHRREIDNLIGKTSVEGYTLVVTKIYDKDNYIKLEIALAKGKKLYDKRETKKKKEIDKNIERALKNY